MSGLYSHSPSLLLDLKNASIGALERISCPPSTQAYTAIMFNKTLASSLMAKTWKDDYLDVLQCLETAVITVWRSHPEMTDHAVARAYEAAFEFYRAQARNQVPKTVTLQGIDSTIFQALSLACETRIGKTQTVPEQDKRVQIVTVEILVDCLRELKKSVERHTKSGGRQGYLSFVSRFIQA